MYGRFIRNTYSMVTNVGIPTLVTMVLTGTTMTARTSTSVSDPRTPRMGALGCALAILRPPSAPYVSVRYPPVCATQNRQF